MARKNSADGGHRFRVSAVSRREWAALGAALLGVVALLLSWTTLGADDPEVAAALADLPVGDVDRSAWASGFFAWAPPLVLLVVGVVIAVFGQQRALRRAGLPQLWLISAVVTTALSVLGWFTLDSPFGTEQRAVLVDAGVTITAGVGRYLGLIAVLAFLVAAILDVRAVRRS